MSSAMVALGFAVCGTSLICYALMTRLQNRRIGRVTGGPSGEGLDVDGSHQAGWGGSAPSASGHAAADSSGHPGDAGVGDSGGSSGDGGDGGGGSD
jgi:hypothetical protein